MNPDALKSAARTAGAVLVAGVVLAWVLWGQRDVAALAGVGVVGAALLAWGLMGAASGAQVLQPADSVSALTRFAASPLAGTALTYARGDHDHGAPELPQPAGDLSGPLTEARVTGLQGVAVSNKKPTPGHILVFNGTAWGPGHIPTAAAGAAATATMAAAAPAPAAAQRAVGRGSKDFDIAAAGEIEVSVGANGILAVSERSSYRGLKGQGAARGERPNQLVIRLQVSEPGTRALSSDRYVVALTPIDDSGLMRDYRLSLRAPVRVEGDGSLQLVVLAESGTLVSEGSQKLRFQMVLNRFEA